MSMEATGKQAEGEGRPGQSSVGRSSMAIPGCVRRFRIPDTYFGGGDRAVPVVPSQYRMCKPLCEYSVPLEEYIAEQLVFKVVGDLLVLGENDGVHYDDEMGLCIADKYDIPPPSREGRYGPYVGSYDEYEEWSHYRSMSTPDEDVQGDA